MSPSAPITSAAAKTQQPIPIGPKANQINRPPASSAAVPKAPGVPSSSGPAANPASSSGTGKQPKPTPSSRGPAPIRRKQPADAFNRTSAARQTSSTGSGNKVNGQSRKPAGQSSMAEMMPANTVAVSKTPQFNAMIKTAVSNGSDGAGPSSRPANPEAPKDETKSQRAPAPESKVQSVQEIKAATSQKQQQQGTVHAAPAKQQAAQVTTSPAKAPAPKAPVVATPPVGPTAPQVANGSKKSADSPQVPAKAANPLAKVATPAPTAPAPKAVSRTPQAANKSAATTAATLATTKVAASPVAPIKAPVPASGPTTAPSAAPQATTDVVTLPASEFRLPPRLLTMCSPLTFLQVARQRRKRRALPTPDLRPAVWSPPQAVGFRSAPPRKRVKIEYWPFENCAEVEPDTGDVVRFTKEVEMSDEADDVDVEGDVKMVGASEFYLTYSREDLSRWREVKGWRDHWPRERERRKISLDQEILDLTAALGQLSL